MKTVSIHPFSALAGAGLLGFVLMAAAAMQVPGSVQRFPVRPAREFRIAGIPDPRQMVVIKEGTPFVVPAGKILAVTGLGGAAQGAVVTVWVDGTREVQAWAELSYGNAVTVREVPPGLVVQAGSTVLVDSGTLLGRAWGYLADA